MAKRPSLAASVKAAAGEPTTLAVPQTSAPPPPDHGARPEAKRAASRAGRKAIYAWVDPAEHRRLKQLSLETERSIDALVTEAVHLLFEKHNAA